MRTRRTATNPSASQALGIQEAVTFLRRGALFGLLAAIAAAAVAYQLTSGSPPVYRATVTLLASQPGSSFGGSAVITPAPLDPGVYQTALMESGIVPATLTRLRGRAPSERQVQAFEKNVHVSLQRLDVSSVIRIAVDGSDPAAAADAANALADGLVVWDRERALQAVSGTITALQASIRQIDGQLAAPAGASAEQLATLQALRQERQRQLAVARATSESSVVVGLLSPLSAATPPDAPIGPNVTFKTLVAALAGLILAYALVFLRWALDPRIRGHEELAGLTDRPVLAEFPLPGRRGRTLTSEAATFLRSNIMLLSRARPPVVVAVSSPQHVQEKSGVVVALAESLVRAGQRTLLVDADLRQTATSTGLEPASSKSPPLEAYLETPDNRFQPVAVAVGRKLTFDFVPSFASASHPVELLNRGFARQLARWQEAYDVILVDCPPVLPYADTLAVAPLCTGLVLCVSQTDSTRRDVLESMERLTQVEVNVLGSVLNHVPARRPAPAGGQRPSARGGTAAADAYRLAGEAGLENVRVRER